MQTLSHLRTIYAPVNQKRTSEIVRWHSSLKDTETVLFMVSFKCSEEICWIIMKYTNENGHCSRKGLVLKFPYKTRYECRWGTEIAMGQSDIYCIGIWGTRPFADDSRDRLTSHFFSMLLSNWSKIQGSGTYGRVYLCHLSHRRWRDGKRWWPVRGINHAHIC